MDVFNEITQHPHLAINIREMRVDTSQFEIGINPLQFLMRLTHDLQHAVGTGKQLPPKHQVMLLVSYRHKLIHGRRTRRQLSKEFGLDDMLQEGQDAYLAMAEAKDRLLSNGCFRWEICDGAAKLHRLESVIFDDGLWSMNLWESSTVVEHETWRKFSTGSPLARNWNPYHLRPKRNSTHQNKHELLFQAVVNALPRLSTPLKKFEHTLTNPTHLEASWFESPAMTTVVNSYAFSRLESLRLDLRESPDSPWTEVSQVLGVIPWLLRHNHGSLRYLRLRLGVTDSKWYNTREEMSKGKMYAFEQVFPLYVEFPNLIELSLSGIRVGAFDFLRFLRILCPKLKTLMLTKVELSDGTWEGLLPAIRWLRLDRFMTYYGGAYYYRNGQLFGGPATDDENWANPGGMKIRFVDRMNDYVNYEGQHPCRKDDDPDDQELWWSLDLAPAEVQAIIIAEWKREGYVV